MALTSQHVVNISQQATRPVYLVRLAHSGTEELLSASGRVEYDGEIYLPGITVAGIEDGESATLTLPATATRVTETQNGTWRHGVCDIYAIPASPSDEASYTDAVLMLDGVIAASSFSGDRVTIRAVQRTRDSSYTPRNLISEFCSNLPAPGLSLIHI